MATIVAAVAVLTGITVWLADTVAAGNSTLEFEVITVGKVVRNGIGLVVILVADWLGVIFPAVINGLGIVGPNLWVNTSVVVSVGVSSIVAP